MSESVQCLDPKSVIVGWDFSTGSVKCLAFDLHGKALAEVRLSTDLWTDGGVYELNLMMLEGQARETVRAIAGQLRDIGRLNDWVAGGISATHHTSGRIDRYHNQVRRAICWNDPTLAEFHATGLKRLGGMSRAKELTGGPWAVRYSLSHLLKDEAQLSLADWQRTTRILPHGSLAAGYLTGRFDTTSVSSAASTGIMDLRTDQWCLPMLESLESRKYREMAAHQLPRIIRDFTEPIGPLADHVALEAGIDLARRPLVYPTSDDQAAGLVGGGAVDSGQMAIILGNSAVVNSSSSQLPASGNLDCMKLNWGRYLWMRCYTNGAQFLDVALGANPNWEDLEKAADTVPPGCGGVEVLPFAHAEPSVGIKQRIVDWSPSMPADQRVRYRAALEAIAYLIAMGVQEHVDAGQNITSIAVSGGIARSDLMCSVLATILNRPLQRLKSSEGPALGAAVTALAAAEQHGRRAKGISTPFSVQDAVKVLVKYREPVLPNPAWRGFYESALPRFAERVRRAAA